MARIICITNYFTNKRTGKEELLVDYAFDEDTLEAVILPCEHPFEVGARIDPILGEWVIPEKKPQPHWGKGAV